MKMPRPVMGRGSFHKSCLGRYKRPHQNQSLRFIVPSQYAFRFLIAESNHSRFLALYSSVEEQLARRLVLRIKTTMIQREKLIQNKATKFIGTTSL